MKVTLLSTYDTYGGAGVAASRLLNSLQLNGVDARMLVHQQIGKQVGVQAFGNQKFALARFAVERAMFLRNERGKAVRFAFSPTNIGVDISKHSLVQEADVLHLHWVNFGFLSLDSLQKIVSLGKPIVWTLHDMWAFTGGCHYAGDCLGYRVCCGNCPFLHRPAPNDLSHRVWLHKKEIFKDIPLTIVACSQWLAHQARQSALFKDKIVISIPNPIDTQVFKADDKKEAREALGLPTDKPLILFAAQNVQDERKGFWYFREAIQRLENPNAVEIVTFGKSQVSDFQDFPTKVHHLGSLTDINKIVQAYQAASVFVMPSLEDNLPNTVMESLACGTPVVGFQTGGIPEMVRHQSTGFIATQHSVEELVEGINWVLFKSDYENLSRNAAMFVEQNFSEKVIANRYMSVYQDLLS